jgi:hypothetical protein
MGHPSICCWGAFIQLCAHRMNQEAGGKSSGIPHLAKNERDVGHPSFVGERKVDPLPSRGEGQRLPKRVNCSSWFFFRFKKVVDGFDGEGSLALQNDVPTSGDDG